MAIFPTDRDDLVAASGPGPNNVDNLLQCTDHMCPVRVHWHIKNNYRDHWRVKLTVSNYHYGANFSDWNVLVQHPNFGESLQSYSFNSTTIQSVANSGKLHLLQVPSLNKKRRVVLDFHKKKKKRWL